MRIRIRISSSVEFTNGDERCVCDREKEGEREGVEIPRYREDGRANVFASSRGEREKEKEKEEERCKDREREGRKVHHFPKLF